MTNASTYAHNFARSLSVAERQVELEFLPDLTLWPWLILPPAHPVLVEKYQYFGAMTASWAMGLFAPEAFTALTRFDWRCEPAALAASTAPTRGLCRGRSDEEGMGFTLDVHDAQGAMFYRTAGDGFVFTDRDFRGWRERSRAEALAAPDRDFALAAPAACGLGEQGRAFVGPGDERGRLLARVGRLAGFHPEHPFHTGSGDHVNAAQLMDCALQAAHLLQGQGQAWRQPQVCLGGEAEFQRYVELDVPFEIRQGEASGPGQMLLEFSQGGRRNARIRLQLSGGDLAG